MPRRDSFSSVRTDSSYECVEFVQDHTDDVPIEEDNDMWSWVPAWPQESNYRSLPQPLPYYPPLTQVKPIPESISTTIDDLRAKIADVEVKKAAAETKYQKATEAHKVAKDNMDKMRTWAITDLKRNELARLTREMNEEEAKFDALTKEHRLLKNEFSPFEDILRQQAEMERIYEEARCVNAEANGELMTNDMYEVLRQMNERMEKERLEEQSTMHRLRLYPKKELVKAPEIVVKRKAPTSWADAVHRAPPALRA